MPAAANDGMKQELIGSETSSGNITAQPENSSRAGWITAAADPGFRNCLVSMGITEPEEQEPYSRVDAEQAAALGFASPTSGIVIAHQNLDGSQMIGLTGSPYFELRHDNGLEPSPGRRYSMVPKSGTHPFFPRWLKKFLESTDFCLITEGSKKASVLSCLGFPCIGIVGWTVWRKTGTDELHDDFRQIPVAGRTIYLIPDFDGAFNTMIHREVQKLSLALYAAKAAEVRLIKLPPVSDKKLGIDDFITEFAGR
jgi:hypothetical protein